MPHKLRIRMRDNPVLTIARPVVYEETLVYIAVANKALRYQLGRSKVVYIGTTKVGVGRIASSAAHLAAKVFDEAPIHGVCGLDFYVITCRRRQKVKTWLKLERGLLVTFLHEFGDVPFCNHQGGGMTFMDVLDYFTEQRLKDIIHKYS